VRQPSWYASRTSRAYGTGETRTRTSSCL
jgi:hypothetical protein